MLNFTLPTTDVPTCAKPTGFKSHEGDGPVGRCVAFHSEWMKRAPEKVLVDEALIRRKRFPVAVVVAVHDEISLMRTALEEVAIVVEHIVSANSCTYAQVLAVADIYLCKIDREKPTTPFCIRAPCHPTVKLMSLTLRMILPVGCHRPPLRTISALAGSAEPGNGGTNTIITHVLKINTMFRKSCDPCTVSLNPPRFSLTVI